MRRLVHNHGCNQFRRRFFVVDKSLVELARVQPGGIFAAVTCEQTYPNTVQTVGDPQIVQRTVLFHRLQRGFDAVQSGLVLERTDPYAVDDAADRAPQFKSLEQIRACGFPVFQSYRQRRSSLQRRAMALAEGYGRPRVVKLKGLIQIGLMRVKATPHVLTATAPSAAGKITR